MRSSEKYTFKDWLFAISGVVIMSIILTIFVYLKGV